MLSIIEDDRGPGRLALTQDVQCACITRVERSYAGRVRGTSRTSAGYHRPLHSFLHFRKFPSTYLSNVHANISSNHNSRSIQPPSRLKVPQMQTGAVPPSGMNFRGPPGRRSMVATATSPPTATTAGRRIWICCKSTASSHTASV